MGLGRGKELSRGECGTSKSAGMWGTAGGGEGQGRGNQDAGLSLGSGAGLLQSSNLRVGSVG